jgi:hypothetical protein
MNNPNFFFFFQKKKKIEYEISRYHSTIVAFINVIV